ncbi:hypothetical protein AKJ09_10449 [Labilithrix luteola]|uniref:Uncharacterized protein n=1 Tax=Labilithrix luteola TaxID=1391654 RepID=A0A0K1QDE0_9BACT|nr:hypothetical protein [Labilithrix luteola]AKV03786.1 hypothetical protein AKJ09_10449 [Labilithrix luteola]
MEKPNTVTVESNVNANVNESQPALELEIRRARKVRTGVKAAMSRTLGGSGPITER